MSYAPVVSESSPSPVGVTEIEVRAVRVAEVAGTPVFQQWLGGQMAMARELAYFYAPTINAYKRYQAGSFAPTRIAWGWDNRTCGFRICGESGGFRVENRIPGADANPYLAFAATIAAGLHGIEKKLAQFVMQKDDYSAIMLKALADRLAEAFAEYAHKLAREAWGFGRNENLAAEDLFRERYRGIRPAAGYPACPDHAEKRTLFDLLEAEKNCGIKLTESFAMHPGASVSGLYFSHPEAKYFGVGKIARDQVKDYAARTGASVTEIEKRLAPNLGYEP